MGKNKPLTVTRLVEDYIDARADESQRGILMRFYKTGPGEYGEGDMFKGVKVPVVRSVVKMVKDEATVDDCVALTASPWHEYRLAGFLILIELYNRSKRGKISQTPEHIVETYLHLIERGNNWDLVDLVAPKILGDYICGCPERVDILYRLAATPHLWHQRVAIVATWMMIRHDIFKPTIELAEKYLTHNHDLIHKATGWMLREVGKRREDMLIDFLDRHVAEMPRTALRYAIEKLPAATRSYYLHGDRKA